RLMGGELILTSEEGKGSTFSLILPEKEPDKVQSPTLTVSKPAIPSSNSTELLDDSVPDDRNNLKIKDKSLLIIEDDRNFSGIVMELAHDKKFKCLLAEDGITGLKLAEEYTPKAIILDINLPKMDGWTVMEKLKDNPDTRHIPVHFMSADDKMMDAKKLGAIGYLLKPSNVEGLQQAFSQIEGFLDKTVKNLLIVTDIDAHHQEIINLLAGDGIEIQQVSSIEKAFETFKQQRHDCIVLDLDVEKGTGSQLLAKMCENNTHCQSPVIIYANRDLTTEENILLNSCANEMPLKSVHSFERLLDEVTLFLHQIAADLPSEKRDILQMIHNKTEIFHNKKVLLVDDDTRNSFALTTVLEDYDMEVIVAVNGKDALEKLAKHDDIAIVLMDIMMPEMDGYEAMKKIRQQSKYRKLPIIALTAKAMKEDKIKCIEAGANDYLAKPINTDKLLSLMRVWLYR
ncbi:MAG: response regulator, partial [Thiomargarita sp.]|nr:response regulator [Thiomargarita sp.]